MKILFTINLLLQKILIGLANDTTNLVFHQALLISSYMIYMPSNVNDANNNNNNNNNK